MRGSRGRRRSLGLRGEGEKRRGEEKFEGELDVFFLILFVCLFVVASFSLVFTVSFRHLLPAKGLWRVIVEEDTA